MVFYYLKRLQITIKTRIKGIEIALAYNSLSTIFNNVFTNIKKKAPYVFIISAVILILSILVLNHKWLTNVLHHVFENEKSEIVVDRRHELSVISPDNFNKSGDTTESAITVIDSITIKSTTASEDTLFPVRIKPVVKKNRFYESDDSVNQFILVANKAFKTMYLLQLQRDNWNVVEEYDIAIGENNGKKSYAGDKKTPEGHYFIIGRKEDSELADKYGPLSYILNYPNDEDRMVGRTGQGIWIHGTDPDSIPMETKGCLEMSNSDLLSLSTFLKNGIGTPVVIVDDEHLTDPTSAPDYNKCAHNRIFIVNKHNKDITIFKSFVNNWKVAWETKNIHEYSAFYDTLRFYGEGYNWENWKKRKLRTFDLYDTIIIKVYNITVTDFDESTAIVKFFQIYTTNLNNNEVAKKLSLNKIDDSWKIVSESMCSIEELHLWPSQKKRIIKKIHIN